ncbi:uncharacterized protein LOC133188195 [Saccostrea echinata]|uniref:uncharacterized protein LOC133188195 n=1 Tax=Saccostrea echinata TaxID=191078 RepID=UPI002A806A2B|nr:uncharacterized protein LOC133188195 [Saccostrea echinata]
MELKLDIENQQLPSFIEETRPAFFQPSFPANKENNNWLYDIVPLGHDRVWAGGNSNELNLFDLKGSLHDTVTITCFGMYLTLHGGHVVYSDTNDKTIKKIIDGKANTLFCTGEWEPYTCTAAQDFLVCLRTTDQTESKVIRYRSSGDVLQEIQYDSQYQPLFKYTVYVVENGNSDICVADYDKKAVTVVDKFGIFRFSYIGNKTCKEISYLPPLLQTACITSSSLTILTTRFTCWTGMVDS